jgi:hypothetical protein
LKVRLQIEEVLTYQSEIVVVQPGDMSDEQFEGILEKVERDSRNESVKDIAYALERDYGIKVEEISTEFPDSPSGSEVEIIDVSNVKEDKVES